MASNGELQSRLVHCTPDLQYVEWLKVGSGGGLMSAIMPSAKRVMALTACTLRLLVGTHNNRQKAALVLVPDDVHAAGAREKELVLLLDSDNAGMQIHWAEALANRREMTGARMNSYGRGPRSSRCDLSDLSRTPAIPTNPLFLSRWLALRPQGRMPPPATPWRGQLPLKDGYLKAIEAWFERATITFFNPEN